MRWSALINTMVRGGVRVINSTRGGAPAQILRKISEKRGCAQRQSAACRGIFFEAACFSVDAVVVDSPQGRRGSYQGGWNSQSSCHRFRRRKEAVLLVREQQCTILFFLFQLVGFRVVVYGTLICKLCNMDFVFQCCALVRVAHCTSGIA